MESDEPLITLTAASQLKWLPCRRNGARPHLSTLLRWVLVGVGGKRLEARRVGHTWCTTERSLRDFFAALTSVRAPSVVPVTRRAAIKRAEAILDAAGVR